MAETAIGDNNFLVTLGFTNYFIAMLAAKLREVEEGR